jgi:hypothetical protein
MHQKTHSARISPNGRQMVLYDNELARRDVVGYPSCGARLYNLPTRIKMLRMISLRIDKLATEEGMAPLAVVHGVLRIPTEETLVWFADVVSLRKSAREVKYRTCRASNL